MNTRYKTYSSDLSRRSFFAKTGAGLLAGSAFLKGTGHAADITTPDSDRYQSITVRTHEWYGDIEERLDLSRDWEVSEIRMAGHDAPVLDTAAIRSRIRNPIASMPLSEIAAGKKTAVITFDDLTRPTPAHDIAPVLIDELNAAGIDDDHILFVGSFGNHQVLSQPDVRSKLGDEVVNRCAWVNHNTWDNVVEVGKTSFGNRIEINNYFMKADVKITISGVKVHSAAGYGGGGKAIVPGVCSFDTTFYNHGVIAGYPPGSTSSIGSRNQTMGSGKIMKNEFRLDMEEAARLAGVDFSVQVVYNGSREPVGVFAGDIRESHIEACKYAVNHYVCEPVRGADIAINNTSPQTRQGHYGVGLLRSSVREGGSGVLILQSPMCLSTMHYLDENRSFNLGSYWNTLPEARQTDRLGQLIIFSQYIQKRDMMKFPFPNTKFARTWDEVLGHLRRAHPGDASVAVYPYGPIQHGPIELG